MPLAEYTVTVGDYTLTEKDYFVRMSKPELTYHIQTKIIEPWNEFRKKYNEPLVVLVDVKILNPYVHLHDWQPKRRDVFACKHRFQCFQCGITGYTYLSLFGEEGKVVALDPEFQKERFTLCKDKLKEMPKSTKLRFC